MEARLLKIALLAVLLPVSMGARFQSANFIVETSDPKLAEQFARTAEQYRRDLAVLWLGQTMPNWAQPCTMTVQVGPRLGAGGATSFVFDRGEVFGWRMNIQGSAERILDSVLPHEVTHMIFATHFRRPLPRWADEGGATSMECASEKAKHRTMLLQFLHTGRGIAFGQMFAMTDYPPDIMPLYAEGYSLAEYLIQHGGRRKYVQFLDDALESDQWSAAVRRHYGATDLGTLQNTWLAWVRDGSPASTTVAASAAAPQPLPLADARRPRPEPNLIYRDRNGDATPVSHTAAINPTAAADAAVLPASGWHAPGQADQIAAPIAEAPAAGVGAALDETGQASGELRNLRSNVLGRFPSPQPSPGGRGGP